MQRFVSALLASTLLAATPLAAQPAHPAMSAAPASIETLVRAVDIPHQGFTLPNGLRVYVHEDHKAPIVAVSVWYHVGSKDEPAGKTGFAHLFEHLMFNGSENAPGDFFAPLKEVGATDFNGTTWFDRTNYFETVPTPALARALWLESDRMGHLLGAVTQKTLSNQINVVQNEKRQNDNEPYGLVQYAQLDALFPAGHPYHHTTIGAMADISGASLEDVKGWFRARYGPNNAVLVLAGDVDLATAKMLVTRYFGDIPRGPAVVPVPASVPTLPKPVSETMTDRVATTRLYRMWAVPGLLDADTVPLDVGASVLGGLSSSRLDNALVRGEKLAVSVSADIDRFERVGMYEVTVDVRPGVDPALVAKRLDALIADFKRTGPTADEVRRVATGEVSGRIRGLESVGGMGGKAVALAEGALYAGDPDFYKEQLARYATVTPDQVKAATAKWLSRPVYALTVAPGDRKAYEESAAGKAGAIHAPAYYRAPQPGEHPLAPLPIAMAAAQDAPKPTGGVANEAVARPATVGRGGLPPVGTVADIRFPAIERTTLSNGIPILYARRDAVPVTRIAMSFDAGNAADPKARLGTQSLMLALLDEGTKTLTSTQIAETQERLGASIGAGASLDQTMVSLSALTPNLGASLDLFADVVRNPAFAPVEVERLKNQQLARIAAEMTEPQGLATRALYPLLYGPGHPYGVPSSGTGDPAVVKSLTRDELIRFKDTWLRPDTARIYVVSDQPLAVVKPLLERSFGDWRAAGGPKPVKDLSAPVLPAASRIVLIDRPQSPQSFIIGAELLPLTGRDSLESLAVANDVLGGDFLSRLNMDLREDKGWSYGVGAVVRRVQGPVPYLIFAPVQANRTGQSIAQMRTDITAFFGAQGITPAERDTMVNGRVRELSGNFETAGDVLGGIQAIDQFGWPDNYYETLAATYRAMTPQTLNGAIRKSLDPAKLTWIVVGDAKVVRPQLDGLGLPVEVMQPK